MESQHVRPDVRAHGSRREAPDVNKAPRAPGGDADFAAIIGAILGPRARRSTCEKLRYGLRENTVPYPLPPAVFVP